MSKDLIFPFAVHLDTVMKLVAGRDIFYKNLKGEELVLKSLNEWLSTMIRTYLDQFKDNSTQEWLPNLTAGEAAFFNQLFHFVFRICMAEGNFSSIQITFSPEEDEKTKVLASNVKFQIRNNSTDHIHQFTSSGLRIETIVRILSRLGYEITLEEVTGSVRLNVGFPYYSEMGRDGMMEKAHQLLNS